MPRAKSSNKNVRKKKNPKNSKNKKKNSTTIATICSKADQKYDEDYDDDIDDYHRAEYYLKINKKISQNKFTSIDCLNQNELILLKEKVIKNPTNLKLKLKNINKIRKENYTKWFVELKTGFNLLFYGVGSKKVILDDFVANVLRKDPLGRCIIINGYFPDITIKQILNILCSAIIDKSSKRNNIRNDIDPRQQTLNIVNYLNDNIDNIKYKSYYITIHNIDGKQFRKNKIIQSIFSILANCKYIHLCSSIDHIHALLLWDRLLLSSFHWIYHEVTTYKHYHSEMQFNEDETIRISSDIKSLGLKHVMKSLTPQHRDIIRILGEYQIDNPNDIGLTRDEWYNQCYAAMLVQSSVNFSAIIVEFIDHKIIIKEWKRKNEIFRIPYDIQIIQNELIDFVQED